jgi:hypothetical protein
VLVAVNSTLRQQRRHLVVLASVLALAGVVVTAHTVIGHDHAGDVVLTCLAVVETAAVAVLVAVGVLALARRTPRLRLTLRVACTRRAMSPRTPVRARAGPAVLQVIRR